MPNALVILPKINLEGEGYMRKNKKTHNVKHIPNESKFIRKLRDEDEYVSFHFDPEGKVIFLNENITPNWLIEKLNTHFTTERDEGVKCWGLSL